MTAPHLFRGVDLAVFVSALAAKLRAAGVVVGLTSVNRCALALRACPPSDTATLYWVTRSCLVHHRDDIELFDRVFTAVFDSVGLPIAPWERSAGRAPATMSGTVLRHSGPTDGLELARGRVDTGRAPEIIDDADDGSPDDPEIHEQFPAALAALADEPFDQLSPDDLELVGRWLESAALRFPTRRSRRSRRAKRGAVDLRRTVASARATGGEPMRLAHRAQRQRTRDVVMVTDVSGSMESFARIYLHLMRSLVVRGRAEVFTFATSLRRVTVPLREGEPQAAIDRLSHEVSDRFSGTRIARSIHELTRSPVWSHSVRGATVIIASDGWDTDPPEQLAAEMARLARLAHRVIWINPRSGAIDYEPAVRGMAAALPSVDVLVSGHSLAAMRTVIEAIAAPAIARNSSST